MLNPARLEFIRDHVAAQFGRDPHGDRPFAGLTVADIGCGGGLLCEPMARLGATVTGVDAAEESVRIARAHAEQMGLTIDYRFRSEENTSELQSLMRISYAVFCLKKKKQHTNNRTRVCIPTK